MLIVINFEKNQHHFITDVISLLSQFCCLKLVFVSLLSQVCCHQSVAISMLYQVLWHHSAVSSLLSPVCWQKSSSHVCCHLGINLLTQVCWHKSAGTSLLTPVCRHQSSVCYNFRVRPFLEIFEAQPCAYRSQWSELEDFKFHEIGNFCHWAI